MTNALKSCSLQEPSSLYHHGIEYPMSLLLDCFKIWHHLVNRTESREPGQLPFSCQNCSKALRLLQWPASRSQRCLLSVVHASRTLCLQQHLDSLGKSLFLTATQDFHRNHFSLTVACPSIPNKDFQGNHTIQTYSHLPTMLLKVEHVNALTMY